MCKVWLQASKSIFRADAVGFTEYSTCEVFGLTNYISNLFLELIGYVYVYQEKNCPKGNS